MSTLAHKQAGFVSLFTVIFFMLLIAVITVGFLRIMGIEQQQALDNDLSASAVAAAESGIEDGKRAILAYNTTTDSTLKTALANAFTSTACDSLTGSPTIRTALGLNSGGNVIGNAQLNQYYTCLNVNLNTSDYIGTRSAGSSDYIPLNTTDPGGVHNVKVHWHLISQSVNTDGDGVPADYASDRYLFPLVNAWGSPADSWTSKGYPAYLRVQLYGYPTNQPITRANIDERTHTMLLIPTRDDLGIGFDENYTHSFPNADPRGYDQPKTAYRQIKCKPNPSTLVGSYACAATLDLADNPALLGPNNAYFLRVTPIYGQTHYRLELQNSSGNAINFNGVQPIVDATGRSADVYRRLQARVRINPPTNLPEFVGESATTICKNMEISDGSYYVANNCP
jgi:Tfp pilus assembly protein PilX